MFRMYEWKPYDLAYKSDNVAMIDHGPRVTFSNRDNVEVFVLTSTEMFFNRAVFPHDSYQQAAKRVFAILDNMMSEYLTDNKRSFSFRLKEWKEFPVRNFEISCDGTINHNFDIDTWHWWMLHALSKLVYTKYHT